MIKNECITVLIQGPLYLNDKKKKINVLDCIKSVKRALPGCKIIISTWDDEKVYDQKIDGLVDKIIYNHQIKPIESFGFKNNVNRQIFSTREGLKCVKTSYVLKIRSNILISKKTYLFSDPGDKLNLLALVGNPVTTFMLFSIPDFVQFGKTENVSFFWDIKVGNLSYFTNKFSIFEIYSFPHNFKFSPEQFIGISWVERKYKLKVLIESQFDVNYSDFILWKRVLSQDFNFIPIPNSGLIFDPIRYTHGDFIDFEKRWLKKPSRFQFLQLLANKFFLFVFRLSWWRQIAKLLLWKISKKNYLKLSNT